MLEESIMKSVKETIKKEQQDQFVFEKKKLYNILGDELVKALREHKAFVAGGFITSLFCNRDYNDVEIFSVILYRIIIISKRTQIKPHYLHTKSWTYK